MTPDQKIIMARDDEDFTQLARELLQRHADYMVLCRKDSLGAVRNTDSLFADVDGTLVAEGATSLSPRCEASLSCLQSAGMAITLVSGRPYEEIMALINTLPPALSVRVLYERGAYELQPTGAGYEQKYLLGSADIDREVSTLRVAFIADQPALEEKYRHVPVHFGWAGTGKQRSLLSIDVFTGGLPERYDKLTGPARDALKVHDLDLLADIQTDIRSFLDRYQPTWQLIHLGNANFEISPPALEKDRAIRQTEQYTVARHVLVIGDSGNDQHMFSLRNITKVQAALVLHNDANIGLANEVDFVTFGMANPYPLFDLLAPAVIQ